MMHQMLLALVLAGQTFLSQKTDHKADLPVEEAAPVAQAQYRSESREVTNWRFEALDSLEPRPLVALAALLRAERPFVTRCVKLNNYWCIKSARWDGELATDNEGHVGFASAEHGADAAATLLRRYYLDFKRKSALDIVRRWAPAECNLPTGIGSMAVLAVKGIGGTLRARYLASRGQGRSVRFTAQAKGGKPGRVSMVIPMTSKVPQYRVPDIAAGMGERKKPPAPVQPLVVARPKRAPQPITTASVGLKQDKPASKPVTACAPDEQRLRNYASRIVEGLSLGPTDDLKLFADDGTPLSNLPVVMRAMSSVELGMLRASPDLVEEAIRRMVERAASRRADWVGGASH